MEATRPRTQDAAKPAAAAAPAVRAARMPGEDRRRQLLGVAVESFARNGFSGTKTRDIAAAAGVSEAILFRHFASKEDLYHAILDAKEAASGTEQWFQEMEALAERRDDRALFRSIARQLISSFRDDVAFHRLLLYASLEGHLLADLFYERFGLPMGDFLGRYVAKRQKEGAFRECEPAAAVLFVMGATIHYAMTRYIFGFGAKKAAPREDVMLDQMVDLILGGLESRPSQRGKPKGIKK
jgi:TetR/AcrR family transcriptional regulator